jgi:outer membrane protein assembly factor BamB
MIGRLPGTLLASLAVACGTVAGEAPDAGWPQFRGVNASGVAAGATPPIKIGPHEGVVWQVEVPWSPSSPCVSGDRIFLTTFHDGRLETRCLERATGRLRWSRGITPPGIEEFHRSDGSPAAATPATDGRQVVNYFGSFGVICHDPEGNERWRHPLPVALSYGKYGSGTSPIIVGDTVVLNRDQHHYSSLLALDLRTGAKRWETPRPEAGGSFGTPVHWLNRGVDEIVVAASGRLNGYDLRTGAERWVITGLTGAICTTPVGGGGMLYFGAWSNAVADSALGSWEKFREANDKNRDGTVDFAEIDPARLDYLRGVDLNRDGRFTREDWELRKARDARSENLLIAVRPGGQGDISETHVAWKYRRALPYVPSPVYYEGRLYFVRDGGLVSSLDAVTGEPFYAQERLPAGGNYYASPVAADGRLYVASLAGKLTVLRAGGAAPEVLHASDFGTRILATPAVVGGNLYLRTATHLFAFAR